MTLTRSACAIAFGKGLTTAEPGLAQRLILVVSDIEVARDDLDARGAEVSELVRLDGGPVPCRDPQGCWYQTLATFVQQPGRQQMVAPGDRDTASGTRVGTERSTARAAADHGLPPGARDQRAARNRRSEHRTPAHHPPGWRHRDGTRDQREATTGVNADWQIVLPDGIALLDIRYTIETGGGDLVNVQSRGVRVGGGSDDTVLRACTQIETASPDLDWMNTSVFISVGGIRQGKVIWQVYLVA